MEPQLTNNNENNPSVEPEVIQPNNPHNTPVIVHKKKWKKIVIIVASIIIIVPLLGYLLLLISLSGGIGGVISDLKPAPDPANSNISSKREAAKSSIDSSFKKLDASVGFTNYATSTHDRCFEGQNNWKVHDGYAHRCSYRVTRFYGFDGDFRQQMTDFNQKVVTQTWSGSSTMTEMLTDYYDQYYGPDKQKTRNFPDSYLVSDLPPPGYSKNNQRMEIVFAEKDTKNLFSVEYSQEVSGDTLFETSEAKKFQDINSVFKKITSDNKFVLVISVQEDYFQN